MQAVTYTLLYSAPIFSNLSVFDGRKDIDLNCLSTEYNTDPEEGGTKHGSYSVV